MQRLFFHKIWGTLSFIFTALLLSCQPPAANPPAVSGPVYTKVFTHDPLSVTIQIDSTEITIADQLNLILQANIPEEYEVVLPSHKTSLGDFAVKDFHTSTPRMTGPAGNVRISHQKTFILEPYLPGTYTIPPLQIIYRNKQSGAEDNELLTEEIQVEVKSFLPEDKSNVQIKDIKPPVGMPLDKNRLLVLAGIFLLLILLSIAMARYWLKRAKTKKIHEEILSPDELAFRDLDKLMAEDLLSKGEIKLFHLRISDILRHYIENRFGLKAPERTTEEFLTELSMERTLQKTFSSDHKRLLAQFLNQCDLVKFAKHHPTIEESEKTVTICREFVEQTREREEI
jgi:hypothetical protein